MKEKEQPTERKVFFWKEYGKNLKVGFLTLVIAPAIAPVLLLFTGYIFVKYVVLSPIAFIGYVVRKMGWDKIFKKEPTETACEHCKDCMSDDRCHKCKRKLRE